jgi:hypothetical protein
MWILVVSFTLLSPTELIVEGALRVKSERHGGLARDDSSWLKAHLLPLKITLKGIKEKPIMRNGEPMKWD